MTPPCPTTSSTTRRLEAVARLLTETKARERSAYQRIVQLESELATLRGNATGLPATLLLMSALRQPNWLPALVGCSELQ